MECIEARALKSSFLSEITMKSTTHQMIFDDFWCVTGINNVVSSEDFSVDDLLDLSDKDFNSLEESEEDYEEKDSLSGSSQDRVDDDNSNSGTSPASGDFSGELAVPVDDLENLEWLSQFTDDSVTELSLLCHAGLEKTARLSGNRTEPAVQNFTVLCLPYPVPKKLRTNRSRVARRTWSLGPLSRTEPSSSSPVQVMESFLAAGLPPVKKQKKNPSAQTGSVLGGALQVQRRCTHCHVNKTPQWRTGPLGPKTLCNACGVRFKSGRLYPEYRPACSPTFSGDLHSNSHRKVLEMRRRKEVDESGSSPAVLSFTGFGDGQMVAAI